MIVVIEASNAHNYASLLDAMFRLRARVFRDRLRWDVEVRDGRERDRYDDKGPVYIIYTDDEAREVKGCLRLLPTTGPTLLKEFFLGLISMLRISAPRRSGNARGSVSMTRSCR